MTTINDNVGNSFSNYKKSQLSYGDSGIDVVMLQNQLMILGYSITQFDGIYGHETKDAVKQFQSSMGLKSDGIAGKDTLSKLCSMYYSKSYSPLLQPAINNIGILNDNSKLGSKIVTQQVPSKKDFMKAGVCSLDHVVLLRSENDLIDNNKNELNYTMKSTGNIAYNVYSSSTKLMSYTDGIGSVVVHIGAKLKEMEQNIDTMLDTTSSAKVGLRKLKNQISKVNQFLLHMKNYGIAAAINKFEGKFTRSNVMEFLTIVSKNFKASKFVATITTISKALKPFIDFMNKIPGLKYIGAIEKICKGYLALFKMQYDNALQLFLNGIREIVESLLLDAAVVALVASGAGLIALVLVIVVFLVDYFFFSDNPENSLVDKAKIGTTQNLIQKLTNGFTEQNTTSFTVPIPSKK